MGGNLMWEFLKLFTLAWFCWWVADATNSIGLGVGLFVGGLIVMSSPENDRPQRKKCRGGLLGLALVVIGVGWLMGGDDE
jgi:hypothetical protein